MAKPQKVSTCLWFDTEAEEAAKFYTSLFANSRVTNVTHYGPDAFWRMLDSNVRPLHGSAGSGDPQTPH